MFYILGCECVIRLFRFSDSLLDFSEVGRLVCEDRIIIHARFLESEHMFLLMFFSARYFANSLIVQSATCIGGGFWVLLLGMALPSVWLPPPFVCRVSDVPKVGDHGLSYGFPPLYSVGSSVWPCRFILSPSKIHLHVGRRAALLQSSGYVHTLRLCVFSFLSYRSVPLMGSFLAMPRLGATLVFPYFCARACAFAYMESMFVVFVPSTLFTNLFSSRAIALLLLRFVVLPYPF